MQDALNGLDGDTVSLKFSGAMKAFIITGVDDPDTIQLVLPVRSFE